MFDTEDLEKWSVSQEVTRLSSNFHTSTFLSAPTGDGILAPTMHLQREYAGGVPEDSTDVNDVEWAAPSSPRRRRGM